MTGENAETISHDRFGVILSKLTSFADVPLQGANMIKAMYPELYG